MIEALRDRLPHETRAMESDASREYVTILIRELVVTETVLVLVRCLELVHVARGRAAARA